MRVFTHSSHPKTPTVTKDDIATIGRKVAAEFDPLRDQGDYILPRDAFPNQPLKPEEIMWKVRDAATAAVMKALKETGQDWDRDTFDRLHGDRIEALAKKIVYDEPRDPVPEGAEPPINEDAGQNWGVPQGPPNMGAPLPGQPRPRY